MAGYIFTLDNIDSLADCVHQGVYSTRLSPPKGKFWGSHHEGTFADYATMRAGDTVFFFHDRLIYGVGRLVQIEGGAAFNNFPGASTPSTFKYSSLKSHLLHDEGTESPNFRWVCFFEPSPYFFKRGIDMDAALASSPSKFRMLRAFWKRSFIKLDDEENQALIDALLKANEDVIKAPVKAEATIPSAFARKHVQAAKTIRSAPTVYSLSPAELISSAITNGALNHEMALEAGLLWYLANTPDSFASIFGGPWDYLSHQVPASPFKPIDYMDKMDVFGYSYIPGHRPTRSRYLVVELKKDVALPEDIDQTMKYVDWVTNEYAHGDYSMIQAFLVASSFSPEAIAHMSQSARRIFTVGARPPKSDTWASFRMVQYSCTPHGTALNFSLVPLP